MELTAHEIEQAHQVATSATRRRLNQKKPDPNLYTTGGSRAVRLTIATLNWSKAFIPVIALLAAMASYVRTIQTASEIYAASGSHPAGVTLAAIVFTVSVEGALFVLALAQEGERMKRRAQGVARRLTSLKSLWHDLLVRIDTREPLPYHESAENDGIGVVIYIALLFAVAANLYIGLRPLLTEIGAVSLQVFFATLWTAPAHMQLRFLVDFAGVIFPPMMTLTAGHLTARFAGEIAAQSEASTRAYEQDLDRWRAAYADPLNTEEGKEVLNSYLQDKLRTKAAKLARENGDEADFLSKSAQARGA